MISSFLDITSKVLECEELSSQTKKQQTQIEKKVNEYNDFFNLKTPDKKFMVFDNETLLPPVPFASTGSNCTISFIGLNPKFDEGLASIEKIKAGNSWEDYASFYNSERVFKFVMDERGSRYYTNKVKLFFALRNKSVKSIGEVKKDYGTNNVYSIFCTLTNENPVLFAELFPFHSKKFNLSELDIVRAYSELKGYRLYFEGIVALIEESTSENGIIILDGVKPSLLFSKLFNHEMTEIFKEKNDDKFIYSINSWRSKKVILTGGVIFGMSTPFNSHDFVEKMIHNIYEVCPEFSMK